MSKFGELANKLRALAEVPHLVVQEASESIEKLISSEFDNGNDPYGRTWKPLKKGGSSILSETGAMKSSMKVQSQGTTIEISFSNYKFAFHQKTRPILSVGTMPVTWSQAIEDAFAKAMNR